MRRLRDEAGSSDPELFTLVELTRAARPLEPSASRKARVRAAVVATRTRSVARPSWALRLAASLLITGAVAFAGVWLANGHRPVPAVRPPQGGRAPVSPMSPMAPGSVITPSPVTLPSSAIPPTAREVSPAAPSRRAPAAHDDRAPREQGTSPRAIEGALDRSDAPSPITSESSSSGATPAPAAPPARSATPAEPSFSALVRQMSAALPSHEAALVAAGIQALRVDADPRRASSLFERYLDQYPQGMFVEEALAMSIEATAAHDHARAVGLADLYLRRYPAGRFHKLARQTRQQLGH